MIDPPLSVRRLEAGRFLVRSQRPECEDSYLVDLSERPHGRCSCLDHSIRVDAPLNRGDVPIRSTCIHVRRVLAELEHGRELCELAGIPFAESIIRPV